ncbi:MAG: DNA polymerase IV, partial [Krumholzibacteria bacterium]|nr:DNA polymerase IV [Candidatus Krumholzibacteria bacterium]
GVTLKFRDAAFATHTRAVLLPRPSDLGEELHREALALLDKLPWRGKQVRLLGVTATRLIGADGGTAQLDLFARPGADRRRDLARAVDALRERFGAGAVTRAALIDDPLTVAAAADFQRAARAGTGRD